MCDRIFIIILNYNGKSNFKQYGDFDLLYFIKKILILSALFLFISCNSKNTLNNNMFIAHAGGAVDGITYTNSKEALIENYKEGRRFFEIDLYYFNKEDKIAILNRASKTQKDAGISVEDFTYEKLYYNRILGKYTLLKLEDLFNFMASNPDAIVIIDVKDYIIDDVDYFDEIWANFMSVIGSFDTSVIDRIYPSVYNVDEIQRISKYYDFRELILAIYKTDVKDLSGIMDQDKFIEAFKYNPNLHLLLPDNTYYFDSIFKNIIKELVRMDRKIIVGTVNSKDAVAMYMKMGATNFITDFLAKKDIPWIKLDLLIRTIFGEKKKKVLNK